MLQASCLTQLPISLSASSLCLSLRQSRSWMTFLMLTCHGLSPPQVSDCWNACPHLHRGLLPQAESVILNLALIFTMIQLSLKKMFYGLYPIPGGGHPVSWFPRLYPWVSPRWAGDSSFHVTERSEALQQLCRQLPSTPWHTSLFLPLFPHLNTGVLSWLPLMRALNASRAFSCPLGLVLSPHCPFSRKSLFPTYSVRLCARPPKRQQWARQTWSLLPELNVSFIIMKQSKTKQKPFSRCLTSPLCFVKSF